MSIRDLGDLLNGRPAPLELSQKCSAHSRRNGVQRKELILLHVTSLKLKMSNQREGEITAVAWRGKDIF
jgi:hypothetical protein